MNSMKNQPKLLIRWWWWWIEARFDDNLIFFIYSNKIKKKAENHSNIFNSRLFNSIVEETFQIFIAFIFRFSIEWENWNCKIDGWMERRRKRRMKRIQKQWKSYGKIRNNKFSFPEHNVMKNERKNIPDVFETRFPVRCTLKKWKIFASVFHLLSTSNIYEISSWRHCSFIEYSRRRSILNISSIVEKTIFGYLRFSV